MSKDIGTYGAGQDLVYYWIRSVSGMGRYVTGSLHLVAIDELGRVTDTHSRRPDDESALSEEEAVLDRLAPAIKQADADLERRRKEKPTEPKPEQPTMDVATRRFMEDAD